MKKSLLNALLIVLLSTIIYSCKNDEENDTTNPLVGKWTFVSYRISNFENTGKTIDDCVGLEVIPTIEFRTDGKSIDNLTSIDSTSLTAVRVMNYSLEGNRLYFDKALAFGTHKSFTFTIKHDSLTLSREENYSTYTESTKILLKKNN